MSNPVSKVRRSYLPGTPPTAGQLVEGQLGLNIPDKKFYVGDNVGGIVDLSYGAGAGLSISNNQFSITDSGVVAGTYTKVTVNAKGQVTVGAQLLSTDVTTALGFTPYNATNPASYISANQNITVSGDATGSGNTAITLTLATVNASVGTFNNVIVNAKGLVTGAANVAYLTGNQAITLSGDATGSGATAIAVTLANSGVTAGTYGQVTVDVKGRVTVGTIIADVAHGGTGVATLTGLVKGTGTTAFVAATSGTDYSAGTSALGTGIVKTTTGTGALTVAVAGDFPILNQNTTGNAATVTTNANLTGDVTSVGNATTLAASGVTAGTFTKVTVDTKGRVTVGAQLASSDVTTALGFTPLGSTGGSVSGNLTFTGGATVTGLPTAVNPGDAASKNYVDTTVTAAINGVSWKQEAAVASTANLTLSGTQTIDGYAAQVGDRVLVKNQTTQTENGVYVVAAGAWSRSVDADAGTEILGMAILVLGGTADGLTQWVNNNATAITIGTTNITFAQLQGSGITYTAGTGLTLGGSQFSITNTGVSTGTFTKVTVNAQGQVTTGAQLASGDVTTALGFTPYNATNPAGYISANQSITLSGDATGSGTTAITVTLAAVGTPGTYGQVTVDSKGRVTGGSVTNSVSLGGTGVSTITGIIKGNGTSAFTAATSGTDYSAGTSALGTGIVKSTTGTGALTIAVAGDFPILNQNTTGNAATVTTNANLTGDVTSVGNATTLSNSGASAGTYGQVTVDVKGRVTAGTVITDVAHGGTGVATITGIIKGSGTAALSAATSGTDYSAGTAALGTGILKSTTSTGALTIAVAGDFPILNQNTTGNAATVTTNANLTGDVTSVGNATTLANSGVTAGTYTKVTVDAKGRVTVGASIASGDVVSALGFSPMSTAGGTFTGAVSLAADPVSDLQPATKRYTDLTDAKGSVRVATTANITLSGTQTIDGVALSVGDRVLVKNQTTGSTNGIYTVAAGTWPRSGDADSSAKVTTGMFTYAEEGTTNAGTRWSLSTLNVILDTTALVFGAFGTGTTYTGGTGITVAGTVISLNATTTNVPEGTNLYYSDIRARASITGGTNVTVNSGVVSVPNANLPYDIAGSIFGKPGNSAVVMRFVAVRAFSFPTNMTNSLSKSAAAATASTVLSIQKNGSQFGTITFAAAGSTGTFAVTATSFAAGDILTVVAQASADSTFGDAEMTFVATLT